MAKTPLLVLYYTEYKSARQRGIILLMTEKLNPLGNRHHNELLARWGSTHTNTPWRK